jgi:hypothetical protein
MIEDPRNPSGPPEERARVSGAIAVLDSKTDKNEEDAIKRMRSVRKRLTGSFQKEALASRLKELVEGASHVKWADDRARRYLDLKRPVLRLRVKMNDECFQNYPNPELESLINAGNPISIDDGTVEGRKNINLFMAQKMNVLQVEIMEPFLTFMFEELQKLEDANAEVRDELRAIFELLPDVKDLKQFLLPSIFRVMSDPKKMELIQVEYIS